MEVKTYKVDGEILSHQVMYNEANQPAKKIYPSGYEVDFQYNEFGCQKAIIETSTGKVLQKNIASEFLGQITEFSYANGVRTKKVFDEDTTRLKSITAVSNPQLLNVHYRYDQV